MDEKRKVIAENLILDNQLSSLKYELEKARDNEKLNDFKFQLNSVNDIYSEASPQINNIGLLNNMKLKIEELEDLIAQQSSINDPLMIADMEKTILEDNKEIGEKNILIEQLKSKIQEILKRPNYIFDEKQAVYSLTQAMREKDVLILDLKKTFRDMKENIYRREINREEKIKTNFLMNSGSKFFNFLRTFYNI